MISSDISIYYWLWALADLRWGGFREYVMSLDELLTVGCVTAGCLLEREFIVSRTCFWHPCVITNEAYNAPFK